MPADTKKDTLAQKATRIMRLVTDGWENTITGTGTTRDKRTGARIKAVEPTSDRTKLEALYTGDDIARKIAGKAPEDMVRKGVTLTVEMGDDAVSERESEIADDTQQALNDLDWAGAFKTALTWARAFGGGLIFLGVDDGGGGGLEDQAKPLDEDRLREVKFLKAFDRFDVEIATWYDDPEADDLENLGEPKTYRILNYTTAGGTTIPQMEVHESRFLRFDGPLTTRERVRVNGGWNDSVYTQIEPILADFGLSWGSVANLLQDFATAVFTSKSLNDAFLADQANLVQARLAQLDMCRSTVRMVPLDEDETLERTVTPVQGLADLLTQFVLRMSAAAEMPVTILFGLSPSGLNNTAEGDIRIWYDQIKSKQETDVRPQLTTLIDLLFASSEGPANGTEPGGWEMAFNSLWEPTDQEQAQTRKIVAETDAIYIDTGVLEPEEVTTSRYGGETYSAETTIDKERRQEEAEEPEPEPAPPVAPAPPAEPIAELEAEV